MKVHALPGQPHARSAGHDIGLCRPLGRLHTRPAIERGRYASSIWLAVQNLFLAARALGLGTRLTTTHIGREQEIKDMLGIPDYVETVALTPLGYPRGRFGTTDGKPAAEVSSYNRWGRSG